MRPTRLPIVLVAAVLAIALGATRVTAQVRVIRVGEENPVKTIAKSTFWGGVTGLALGAAVALVAEKDEEDIIKWFFVGGVFGGFAFGVYHVLTREPPSTGLIDIDEDGLSIARPSITMTTEGGADLREPRLNVTLLSLHF